MEHVFGRKSIAAGRPVRIFFFLHHSSYEKRQGRKRGSREEKGEVGLSRNGRKNETC